VTQDNVDDLFGENELVIRNYRLRPTPPEARTESGHQCQHRLRASRRVIGHSPTSGHAEPSWAVELPLDESCDLGLRFHQDAVYYVSDDQLRLTDCADRRLLQVGSFSGRVDADDPLV